MSSKGTLDKASLPNELRLMLAILSLDHAPEIIGEIRERAEAADWDKFLAFVNHHRVYPLIYRKLKELNIDSIPEYVQRRLYQDYRSNTFKMLQLAAEMERICQTFQEARLRLLVLKGPVLGMDLYGDLSMRTSKDLDLFIAIDDLEQAEKLLTQLGYESRSNVPRIFNDWKWRAHHISYYHRELGIQVEIHWKMQPNFGKEPKFNDLWNRKSSIPLSNGVVHCLSKEDLMIYLITHGARHAWFRMRWIIDISRLMDTIPESSWRHIIKASRRLESVSMIGQCLVLVSALLHKPLPDACKPLAERPTPKQLAGRTVVFIRDMVQLNPTPPTKKLKKIYKKYLLSLMSKRQKFVYYVSSLYPSSWDVQYFPLPRYLYFLYVPLRPVLWLWRIILKHDVDHNGVEA